MRLLSMATCVIALMVASTAMAREGTKVGIDAPSLSDVKFVMNEPTEWDGDSFQGQVTLVELWGIN